MSAVHISIGHDDDFMVPQLRRVKLLADAGAQGGDDRLELLTDKEAAALAAGLDQKRELAINKISRAFGLHPAGKDEIEKALSDRRQPCRKSGMER